MEIGAGHVARCAALAQELYARGIKSSLLTRSLPGSSARPAEFLDVIFLPAEPDADARVAREWLSRDAGPSLLIVDHYGLGARWEREARGPETRVAVIDDLADRPHECDVLIDQNPGRDHACRYAALVPAHCTMLAGSRYAMLRPEFRRERERLRIRDGHVRRCLVFFGGTDPADVTMRTLEAISALRRPEIAFDVVIGAGNPRRAAIESCSASIRNVVFHCQSERMAALMAAADVSIGAGGTATWERCCVGLPSLVVITAENQRMVAVEAAASGVCVNLGDASDATASAIGDALDAACTGRMDLAGMSSAALGLIDGGGASRVADTLLEAR